MAAAYEDSTLSTYTATDGDNIAVQDWPSVEDSPLRGVVLLVHGLGEHAGRYERLARTLNGWGFAVRGYDQYGHGESGGARGDLPSTNRLVDDLADLVESTRSRMEPGLPLVLVGHSLGGLVASCFVAQQRGPVDGLVLSSPALDLGLSAFQKLLLSVLPRVAPHLRVSNGLDPNFLSHDDDVIRRYRGDPLVHDRISGILARFMADGCEAVRQSAPAWNVPTLLMYAGADQLVNPAGSRAFAAAAPQALVRSVAFDDLFHEIFNEVESEAVYATLRQWLDERF